MKRCVLSLERNIGREDEFRVSGGSEFQRRGPMTEKALLPSDDRTYGMERTSESEDRVETECEGNERRTIVKICRLLICKCFVCEKTGFVVDSLFDRKPV